MYRQDLDVIKGLAIIAVVLFHLGLLKSGYLGVDTFFVINGFLLTPSVYKRIKESGFSFFGFMEKRIVRLLPLIVLASAVCLIAGYFCMMPDHYENLGQTIIAGNLMSENILSAITTKNYWDVVNDYKPLMHLWYVGILFEFYIALPLFMMLLNKVGKLLKQDGGEWMIKGLLVASVVSLILYLGPTNWSNDKFYYLPSRFFELGFGGLIALKTNNSAIGFGTFTTRINQVAIYLLIIVLASAVYNQIFDPANSTAVIIGSKTDNISSGLPLPKIILLLTTVALTCILVGIKNGGSFILRSNALAWIGKMSYSIFIWHQVLLAFYRYTVSDKVTVPFFIGFVVITLLVSMLTYYFVEQKVKTTHKSFIVWVVGAFLVMLPSGWLFMHAGVVRDIPELDVKYEEAHRGMFGEYCDRVYAYYTDFTDDNGKPNVLVVGVSFGRDFANVLLESDYKDSINLSYGYNWTDENIVEKVKKSDYIFSFSAKDEIPEFVWNNLKGNAEVWGIGTKNYGACNGIIYTQRSSEDYFDLSTEVLTGYKDLNKQRKKQWGNKYFDLLTPALMPDGTVRVFTPDHKYIAQDCRHLTKAGAQWYASLFDWELIFKK